MVKNIPAQTAPPPSPPQANPTSPEAPSKVPKAPPTEAELRAKYKLNGDRALKAFSRAVSRTEKVLNQKGGSEGQRKFFRDRIDIMIGRMNAALDGIHKPDAGEVPSE